MTRKSNSLALAVRLLSLPVPLLRLRPSRRRSGDVNVNACRSEGRSLVVSMVVSEQSESALWNIYPVTVGLDLRRKSKIYFCFLFVLSTFYPRKIHRDIHTDETHSSIDVQWPPPPEQPGLKRCSGNGFSLPFVTIALVWDWTFVLLPIFRYQKHDSADGTYYSVTWCVSPFIVCILVWQIFFLLLL